MNTNGQQTINREEAVNSRYGSAATTIEPALCCPVAEYDSTYLANLPKEILDIDYGCGDPSKYARPGETVLDLGSGSGKICYIIAQKVGADGRVIGVDFNDRMLQISRRYQREMATKLGYANVSFRKGRIQDLALDHERLDQWLQANPIQSANDLMRLEAECERLRRDEPMIKDDSIDLIVSNCVLNLVDTDQKTKLFNELHRVLRPGGRAVISDIVCDEDPTEEMKNDPELWSGCISGAFREDRFLQMFEEAGFFGIEILTRATEPWQTIDGIEFRSMTVQAYKGKDGPCLERNQSIVYRGPWKKVHDDDGHVFPRGERMAVCDKTYKLLTNPDGPYAKDIIGIEPREEVPLDDAKPFDCKRSARRHPRETKGIDYDVTHTNDNASCTGDSCC
jgi:arsenite methyltransferase